MRLRRRCCRGFCAALSIQHPLFLPLYSTVSLPTISLSLYPHSLSLFFPAFLSHSIYVFNSIFLSLSISFSLSHPLSLSLPFIYHSVSLSVVIMHMSLFLLFISVTLMILLPSWRFHKLSLSATTRSIPATFVFFENLKSFCEIR